jgi:pimeloyl-ACP methyl ester carboxylesterase
MNILTAQSWRRSAFAFLASTGIACGVSEGHAADLPTVAPPQYLTLEQLRSKYREPGSKIVRLKGVDVYYMDEGRGPAILMVHGSSSSLKTYDRIAAKLKNRYRVIRYDIPPFGLSGPVSDEAAAAGVRPEELPEALLDYLGVKQVTVVGVSSGGTMGYFLAARRPDLVERLILSNAPAAVVDTKPMKLSRALAAEEAIPGALAGTYKRRSFWDAFFDFFTGEPSRMSAAHRDEYYDFNRRVPEKHALAFTAVVADHAFTVETAAKVVCPVLLVWGERDPLLTPPSADVLAGYLTHADVSKLMLPDVGHYPPLEVPDRYAQIIAAYIEGATPVRPLAPPPSER